MSTKSIITAFAIAMMTITACGRTNEQDTNTSEEVGNSKKVLVAYFSATGTTKTVAEELSGVMDATLFEITPAQPYTAEDLDWRDSLSRSSVEMHNAESRPEVKNKVDDIAQYDVVFLGFPVWWYVAPTIINTFIDENNLEGKKVYCFATSGGSPIGPCVEALKKQYPDIDWQDGKLLNRSTKEILEDWKREIGL